MTQHQQANHLLVLDTAIEAPEQLIQGAVSRSQVLRLTGDGHAIEQISDYLEQHQTIDTVHLLAHGRPGGVQLGQIWLTGQNLEMWAHRLGQWSQFLRPQASVILYGCRTAAGTLGQEFLSYLHELLGVTIAASTQVVGRGNWQFDRILGPKCSQESRQKGGRVSDPVTLPFHQDTLVSYPGSFDPPIPNFLYATDPGDTSLDGNDPNRVSRLYIINPDTGEFETHPTGEEKINLDARTFALSRAANGWLYYTGIEDGADNPVSVYRFDPSDPQNDNDKNGKVGTFQHAGFILRLGQGENGKLYAMNGENDRIYVLDVDENTELGSGDLGSNLETITLAGPDIKGGGDLAFDPKNPNILYFSAKDGGGQSEYKIYRVDISTITNGPVTPQEVTTLKLDGNNVEGIAGSLAFGADGNIYLNAQTTMYRVNGEALRTANGGTLTMEKVKDFQGIGNWTDFASLPTPIAALEVDVDKRSDGQDQVNPDGEIVYTITIKNTGGTTIDNIIVSDPLPDGISKFSWTRDIAGDTESGTGAIEDDRFALAAGQEAVYTVIATVQSVNNLNLDEDNIINQVTVRVPGFAIVDPKDDTRLLNSLTTSDSIQVGNRPPEVIDSLVTTPPGEQTPVTGLLGTDDGEIARYVIRSIPSGGTLRLGDRTIQAGDEIDPADIGNLVFDAGDNFNGSSFTYTAIDNLGAESEPGTITLNSPPTATGGSETIPPGSATNLSDSLLSANDPDGDVNFFKITELPPTNQGRLFIGDPERGGREVKKDDRLAPGELDQLFFKAEPGFTGTSFEFIAIDNDGGRSRPAEVTLDVGNSPPETNDALQVIEPGAPVTLEGLGGTDIEDDDDDLEFEIEELPGEGTLTLNGNPVSVGQRLTAEELSQLQFEFPEGFSGNTSFKYAAIDSDGLKDPTPGTVFLKTEGSNIPPDTNEVTQNVPPNTFGGVNEIPAGVATRLTGLGGNDPDGDVREFRITQAPSNGTLFLGDPGDGGRALGTGDRIPKDRINDVFFLPGNNFNGTNFRYAAVDNEGEEDPTPAQVTLDVGNRFPDTDNVTNPLPDPGQIIRLSGLGGSDADGQVIGFVINTLPNRGRLFLGHPEAGGVPIEEGQILTVSEIGRLFLDVGDGTGDIRFTYSAIDNLGAIDPIPGEVLFTDRTTAPGDEEDDEDDDPVSEIGVDPSPTPIGTPSPSPSPEPEPEEDFESLCPPKPEKPEIPDLPELPDITRQMPELPVLEVDGLEQLNSRETSENTSGDTVVGGAEDNDIRGSAGDDQLRGGDGDDLIVTGGGNNVLAGNAGDDTILGHVGADTIYGGRDNDLILGRGGNNVIWGDRGNDTISGGPGDDIIGGGPQNRTPDFEGSDDLIYGDAGNDTIFGNLGQNSLSGGDGDDLIFGGQGDDLIFGDAGNDTLKGESGNDTLIGSPDTIEAARDDDTLPAQEDMLPDEGELNLEELTFEALAGLEDPRRAASEETDSDATDPEPDPEATTPGESEPEADDRTPTPDPVNPERPLTFEELAELDDPRSTASEETDSDETQPDSGPDSEATPPEDGSDADSEDSQVTPEPDPQPDPDPDADPISEGDLLSGNQGNDVLFGGAGNDTLFGGNDDDWLDGGSGDDLLFGDRGSDTLYGNRGNNTLVGGSLDPAMIDEDGPDLIYGGNGNDLIFGNRGDDTIFTGNGNNLAFGGQDDDLMYGGQGSDTLKGEFGDDTLLGSPRSLSVENSQGNVLTGNQGNDLILAGHGGDSLYGGNGDDLIFGGDGEDLIFGDRGNDTIHGGGGNDTLVAANGNPLVNDNDGNNLIFTGEGNNLVLGGSGDDSLVGEGGNDTIRGGSGDDMVWGGGGDDLLFGGHGNDTLCGGGGNDTLVAGNGNPADPATGDNLLIGAAGNNLMFGNGGQDTFQGGLGNDTIFGGSGDVIAFGEAGRNVIFGQRGNDTLAGGNGDALLHGGQGNDVLFGNGGNNTLYGGQGDDTLYSGRGNSLLFGDEGDDLLFGQRGNDTLVGGGGQNGFAITNEAQNNLILDFDIAQDAFVLFDGITQDQLTFGTRDGQTLLQRDGQTIAILVDVGIEQVNDITFR